LARIIYEETAKYVWKRTDTIGVVAKTYAGAITLCASVWVNSEFASASARGRLRRSDP